MNWKQVALKAAKGSLTAGGGAAAGMLANGIPMSRHGWLMVGAVAGGAAFHAGWNFIEQALNA